MLIAAQVGFTPLRIVDFFWVDPGPALVDVVHRGGALAGWPVSSLAAAQAPANAGRDVAAVQAIEADGHTRPC